MALIELEEGPGVLFIGVPESKTVKNRLHLDVDADRPDSRRGGRAAARASAHVSTRITASDDGTGWVTMLDPEGNEFCVERCTERLPETRRLSLSDRPGDLDKLDQRTANSVQYDGWEGSIWLTQAETPPPTCTEFAYPAPLSTASASADRTPVLQCSTICLSLGQLRQRVAVEELALGDQDRARDLVDLELVRLAHVDEHEVALAVLALLEPVLEGGDGDRRVGGSLRRLVADRAAERPRSRSAR